MIFNSVKRSSVFDEFSEEEQEYWFSLKGKKTLHHIDTFYYSIRIYEARVIDGEFEAPEILKFIKDLDEAKQEKNKNMIQAVMFHGLSVELRSFSGMYQYCISENALYDIFIAKTIINDDTPRILVQLRTEALIQYGVQQSIDMSYDKIVSILTEYGIHIDNINGDYFPVNENRIDYAWHTNLIQDFSYLLSDEYLRKHLKSRMRNGMKHFDPSTFTHNYLAVGDRRSNNVFFRAYDKTKEVVEQGYKGFFLERWLQNGLISRYDHYCLMRAYEMRSYTVGVLGGRIEWYLEHGKDENRKKFLTEVREKYFISTTNSKYIRTKIGGKSIRISCMEFSEGCKSQVYSVDGNSDGDAYGEDDQLSDTAPCSVTLDCMLPPTTTIINCEYQTKRHFYRTLNEMISHLGKDAERLEFTRMTRILALHKNICDYLTGYSGSCCFVRDRNAKLKKNQLQDEPETVFTDWWWLLRNTKINKESDEALFRCYQRKADIERAKKKLVGDIATLTMLLNQTVAEQSFHQSALDVLSSINDNDLVKDLRFASGRNNVTLMNMSYSDIHRRKQKNMKNLVEVPEPAEGEENNET